MELIIDQIATQELADTGSYFDPQYPNVSVSIGKLSQNAIKRVEDSKKKPSFTDRLSFLIQRNELEDPQTEIVFIVNNCNKKDNSIKNQIGRGSIQLAGFRPTPGVPFKATINLTHEDSKGKKVQKGTLSFQGTITATNSDAAATVPSATAASQSAESQPTASNSAGLTAPGQSTHPSKPTAAPAPSNKAADTSASTTIVPPNSVDPKPSTGAAAHGEGLVLKLRSLSVKEAKNVEIGMLDSNDLYAIVRIDEAGFQLKTKTKDGAGSKASWNYEDNEEESKATIRRGAVMKARFELWDENSRNADKLIGVCETTLSHLDPNLPQVMVDLNFLDGGKTTAKGEAQFFVQSNTDRTVKAESKEHAAIAAGSGSSAPAAPIATAPAAATISAATSTTVPDSVPVSKSDMAPKVTSSAPNAIPAETSKYAAQSAAPVESAIKPTIENEDRKYDLVISHIKVWDAINVEKALFDSNDLYVVVTSANKVCSRIKYTSPVRNGAGSKAEWTVSASAAAQLQAVDRCSEAQLRELQLKLNLWDHNNMTAHVEIGSVTAVLTPEQLAQLSRMQPGNLGTLIIPLSFEEKNSKEPTAKGELSLSVASIALSSQTGSAAPATGKAEAGKAGAVKIASSTESVRITAATLFVRKIVCQNLTSVERLGGKNDPFVSLALGASTYQTEVAEESGTSAIFDYLDCSFRVDEDVLTFDPLIVKVIDFNNHFSHVLIGQSQAQLKPLAQLLDKGVSEFPLDIFAVHDGKIQPNKITGRVVLYLELKSLSTSLQKSIEEVVAPIATKPGLLQVIRARCFDVPGLDNASTGLIVGVGAKKAILKLSLGEQWQFTSQPLELALTKQQVFDDLQQSIDNIVATTVQQVSLRASIYITGLLPGETLIGEGQASLLSSARAMNEEMQLTVDLQKKGSAAGRVVLTVRLCDPAQAEALRKLEKTPELRLPAGFTAGELRVDAIYATGIKNIEMIGRQDPYVTLRLGDWNYRTTTLDGGNVSWTSLDVRTAVTATQLNEQPLQLQLFEDNVGKDVLLGTASLQLLSVLHELDTMYEHKFEMRDDKGKATGNLRLCISLHPPQLPVSKDKKGSEVNLTALVQSFKSAQPEADPVFLRIQRIDCRDLKLNHLLRKPTPIAELTMDTWQWATHQAQDVVDGRTAIWDLLESETNDVPLHSLLESSLAVKILDQNKPVAVGTLTPQMLVPRLLQANSLGNLLLVDCILSQPSASNKEAGRCTVHLSLHPSTHHKRQLQPQVEEEMKPAFENCLLRFARLKVQGLRQTELIGQADPFAVIRIGEVYFAQTSVLQDAGVDATWPELQLQTNLIPASLLIDGTLDITLHEKNEYFANAFLGRSSFALKRMAFIAGKEVELTGSLMDVKGSSLPGKVSVVLEALPVSPQDIPKLPADFQEGELRLVRVSTFGLHSKKLISTSLDPFIVARLGQDHEERSGTLNNSGPDATFEHLLMRRRVTRKQLEELVVSLEVREATMLAGAAGKLLAKGSLALATRLTAVDKDFQVPLALVGADGQAEAGRALLFLRLSSTFSDPANQKPVELPPAFSTGRLIVERAVLANFKSHSFLRQLVGGDGAPSLLLRLKSTTTSDTSSATAADKPSSGNTAEALTKTLAAVNISESRRDSSGACHCAWLLPDATFEEVSKQSVMNDRIEVLAIEAGSKTTKVLAAGSIPLKFAFAGQPLGEECEVNLDLQTGASADNGRVSMTLRLVPWDLAEQAKDLSLHPQFSVGTLKIRRIDALHLRRTEMLTKQDPYVELSLPGVWMEATPVQNDADTRASWDHLPFAAVVYADQLQTLALHCAVKNQNNVGGDVLIGRGEVKLCRPTHAMETEVPLEVTLYEESKTNKDSSTNSSSSNSNNNGSAGKVAGKLRLFVTLTAAVIADDDLAEDALDRDTEANVADLSALLQERKCDAAELCVTCVSIFGLRDDQFFGLSRLDPSVSLFTRDPSNDSTLDLQQSSNRYETETQHNAGGTVTWEHLDFSELCDRRAMLQNELVCQVFDGTGKKKKKLLGDSIVRLKRVLRHLGEETELRLGIYSYDPSKKNADRLKAKRLGTMTLKAQLVPRIKTQPSAALALLPADFQQGFLHIQRLEVRGLRNKEWTGKQDPFVQLRVSDCWSDATQTLAEAGENAVWPQLGFCVDVNREILEHESLRLEVKEQNDLLRSDISLGVAQISLRALCAALEQPLELQTELLDPQRSNAHCGSVHVRLLLSRTSVSDTRVVLQQQLLQDDDPTNDDDLQMQIALENIPDDQVVAQRGVMHVLQASLQANNSLRQQLSKLTQSSSYPLPFSSSTTADQGAFSLRLALSLLPETQNRWLQRSPSLPLFPEVLSSSSAKEAKKPPQKQQQLQSKWEWTELETSIGATALTRDDLLQRRIAVSLLLCDMKKMKETELCRGEAVLRRLGATPHGQKVQTELQLQDDRGRAHGRTTLSLKLNAVPESQDKAGLSAADLKHMAAVQVSQVSLVDVSPQLQASQAQLGITLKLAAWQSALPCLASSPSPTEDTLSAACQWCWDEAQSTPPLAVSHLLRDGLAVTLRKLHAKTLLQKEREEEIGQCRVSLRPCLDGVGQWVILRQSLLSETQVPLGTLVFRVRLTQDDQQLQEISSTGACLVQSTAASHATAATQAAEKTNTVATHTAAAMVAEETQKAQKKMQALTVEAGAGDLRVSHGDAAAAAETVALKAKIHSLEVSLRAGEKQGASVTQLQQTVQELQQQLQQQQALLQQHLKQQKQQQQLMQQQQLLQQQEQVAVSQVSRVELPKNVESWRGVHVQAWLAFEAELPEHLDAFARAAVDGVVLLRHIDLPMLKEHLGVSDPLHLARLAAGIEALKLRQMKFLQKKEAERKAKEDAKRLEEERHRKKQQEDKELRKKKKKKKKNNRKQQQHQQPQQQQQLLTSNLLERTRLESELKKIHANAKEIRKARQGRENTWRFEFTDGLTQTLPTAAPVGDMLWSETQTAAKRHARHGGSNAYDTAMSSEVFAQLFASPSLRGDQAARSPEDAFTSSSAAARGSEENLKPPRRRVMALPASATTDDVQAAVAIAVTQLAQWLRHVEIQRLKRQRHSDADLDMAFHSLEDDFYQPDDEADGDSVFSSPDQERSEREVEVEGHEDAASLPGYEDLVSSPTDNNSQSEDAETKKGNKLGNLQLKEEEFHKDDEEGVGLPSYEEIFASSLSPPPPQPRHIQQESRRPRSKLAEKRGLPGTTTAGAGAGAWTEEEAEAVDGARLAFEAMVSQQNNDAHWLGANSKLTRLKLEGALLHLLRLRVSWAQFDALWTRLDHRRTGDLDFDEFRGFFFPHDGGISTSAAHFTASTLLPSSPLQQSTRQSLGKTNTTNAPQSTTQGMAGSSAAEMRALKDTLYALCDTLRHANFTVTQMFAAFDRDNSGEISLSEFTSLLKSVLGPAQLTRLCHNAYYTSTQVSLRQQQQLHPSFAHRLLFQALRSVDSDGDGRVSLQETLLLVYRVWRAQLRELSKRLFSAASSTSSSQNRRGGGGDSLETEEEAERRMSRLQKERDDLKLAIKRNFPRQWRDTLERLRVAQGDTEGDDTLPGPFTHLLRHLQLGDAQPHTVPLDTTGQDEEDASGGAVRNNHNHHHRDNKEGSDTVINSKNFSGLRSGSMNTGQNELLRIKIRPPQGTVPTRSVRPSSAGHTSRVQEGALGSQMLMLSMPPARDLFSSSAKADDPMITGERTTTILRNNQQRHLGGLF